MRDHVKVFKALASDTRIRILQLLHEHSQCVNALTVRLSMTQPAVSQNLRMLKEAGLVCAAKRGSWMHYALVPGSLEPYGKAVAEILADGAAGEGEMSGSANCPPVVLKACPGGSERDKP